MKSKKLILNKYFGVCVFSFAGLCSAGSAFAGQVAKEAYENARSSISQTRMSDLVKELALPKYGGRLPGSQGDVLSRDWLLAEYQDIGLLPAGEQGYLQHFSTTITEPDGADADTPRNPEFGKLVRSSNILGVIPGNDPLLKHEVIIVSAHRDHLGHTPDGIHYPGANDDLSGVAATLEIARAFVKLNGLNKRTLLFAAYGAEEQGDMGSTYHAAHPVPYASHKNVVLMISIDMVGRGFEDWTRFSSKTLNGISQRWFKETYNGKTDEADVYSHKYPVTSGSSFSYDAGAFAQLGVSTRVIGLADGIEHYHQTTDTWENVQFEPALVVTKTIFDFVWKVDQDPKVRATR